MIRVGKIIKTHGLKGEVKLYPYTTDMDSYLDYEYVILEDKTTKLYIESVRYQNNIVILKFQDLNRIEDVEKYINKYVFIDDSQKRTMQEDEYHIQDLVGIDVYNQNDEKVGIIKDVLLYPANDVIVVNDNNGKEILVPNVKEFVKEIDIENKKIVIHFLKGMM